MLRQAVFGITDWALIHAVLAPTTPIYLLPPGPQFFFNSLLSRLSSCKAIQRWEPEGVGAWGGGSLRGWGQLLWEQEMPRCCKCISVLTCSSPWLGSSTALDLVGYFLPSLASQWWSQGGVGNRTGKAWQLSPKPVPLMMETYVPRPHSQSQTGTWPPSISLQEFPPIFISVFRDLSTCLSGFCGNSKVRVQPPSSCDIFPGMDNSPGAFRVHRAPTGHIRPFRWLRLISFTVSFFLVWLVFLFCF